MKQILLLSALCLSTIAKAQIIDLSGIWETELGICNLPGTTDENKLGGGNSNTHVTTQLTRLYPHEGALTYSRKISIGKDMADKKLTLFLERTKPSTLWIDGDSIGSICQLYAPHEYVLPRLNAGEHTISLRIDNRSGAVPQGVHGSHAWTDATQTNWNGILGKMEIIAADIATIKSVNVYPDIKNHCVNVKVAIMADKAITTKMALEGISEDSRMVRLMKGENIIERTIHIDNMRLWSEFHPDLYDLKVSIHGKKHHSVKTVRFGMREFGVKGTQLTINGLTTFLRGTHDGCVFPLTGYCPTDVEEWKRLFLKAKEYGINHYRFHSYTPTEAAFEAADEVGMYLQTELPLWGHIEAETASQNEFMLNEARTLIKAFGNHPSFMSLGLGNELWGDHDIMKSWLDEFRKTDNRHLYVYGSNNSLGWNGAQDGEDYFVTCRVGGGNDYKTNTRTSFSFADEDDGGILNHRRPNTRDDFSHPVSICPRPIIAHETCQFQMYPDYGQISQYKGVLYPYNLEVFRDRLNENGLASQAKDFTKATTKWALECYKADIEYCVRTKGFGGYQLLDIKDYPGQGSALCGILDAFMNQKDEADKKVIDVMQPIVPMLVMDKFCWEEGETFNADILLCNYTEKDIDDKITIQIHDNQDIANLEVASCVRQGCMDVIHTLKDDNITRCPDGKSKQIKIVLVCGNYKNEYNIWVYAKESRKDSKVIVADTLNSDVIKSLVAGKTVLLTPRLSSIEKHSIGGLFTPDYWNYAMFKTISENNNRPVSPGSLGMMVNMNDRQKSIFNTYFPNEGHSDWQWWCIAKNSRPLILNTLDKDYRPLIQTIDNVERNHKLGILMEFKIGNGKLLISATDLKAIDCFPEGRAYANAIMSYAQSNDFCPTTEISIDNLRTLLYTEVSDKDIQGVKNITDYKHE